MKPTKESKDRWYRGTFAIGHPEGLHTRPAAQFVKLAQQFPAQIEVRKGKFRVDGKSILNLLALGAKKGTQVTLLAKGTKAKEAIATLGRFIQVVGVEKMARARRLRKASRRPPTQWGL